MTDPVYPPLDLPDMVLADEPGHRLVMSYGSPWAATCTCGFAATFAHNCDFSNDVADHYYEVRSIDPNFVEEIQAIDDIRHPRRSARRGARRLTAPGRHPTQYSPEVLVVLAELIRRGEHIHDPFAGPGLRLGRLCDELGATFTGGDIDGPWADGVDPRVTLGADARDPATYPPPPFRICTSPTYANKRFCNYPNGPLTTTKTERRRDYGIALGRALDPRNLARFTGHQYRKARAAAYWRGHSDAVKSWGEQVILNVDEPISEPWQALLAAHGYAIEAVIPAFTRRYGGLDNAEKRAEHEVVVVAERLDA